MPGKARHDGRNPPKITESIMWESSPAQVWDVGSGGIQCAEWHAGHTQITRGRHGTSDMFLATALACGKSQTCEGHMQLRQYVSRLGGSLRADEILLQGLAKYAHMPWGICHEMRGPAS